MREKVTQPAQADYASGTAAGKAFFIQTRRQSIGIENCCLIVEFLAYHDDRSKLRSFAYVWKKDAGETPHGHYVFLDELGERSFSWRKWKGKWQFGWRYRQ